MPAKRLNNSALGGFERPALAWMAQRLPVGIVPDHLTAIGFAGAIAAAIGYVLSRWSLQWLWLACAGLIVNWLGDSLDGTVARLRRIERPRYGFFIDHTSDLFAQSLIFIALGFSPCARLGMACLGLVTFLMAFVYSLICAEVRNTFRITYFGFGPTEIRALLVIGNLLSLEAGVFDLAPYIGPFGAFGPVTIYEFVIAVIFGVTVPALAMLARGELRVLSDEDPPPSVRSSSSVANSSHPPTSSAVATSLQSEAAAPQP